MARFVTFLSDYGLQDEFVGTCHGVIKRIAPDVQIIDLTHGIPSQNVLHGALVLAKARCALERVSRTFHGRDLFAPAAAHRALGVSAGELGPPLDPEVLVRVTIPEAEISSTRIGATTLAVDRFGNVQLNLGPDVLGAPGTRVAIDLPGGRRAAVVARTFADVAHGELVLFEDSSGNVSLAVSGGSASAALGLTSGEKVWIEIGSRRA